MSSKRRRGDRKDGKLIRDIDALHYITGIIYPNRCDNEAYISERIDLRPINEYLAQKNADNPEYKYNCFQVIVTALAKTIMLRPKLNRFIVNSRFYQRNEVSTSFVVKRQFSDKGEEVLAFIHAKEDDTIDTVHDGQNCVIKTMWIHLPVLWTCSGRCLRGYPVHWSSLWSCLTNTEKYLHL